jgi:hypothetical protein
MPVVQLVAQSWEGLFPDPAFTPAAASMMAEAMWSRHSRVIELGNGPYGWTASSRPASMLDAAGDGPPNAPDPCSQLPFQFAAGAVLIRFSIAHNRCATGLHTPGNDHSPTLAALDAETEDQMSWTRTEYRLCPRVNLRWNRFFEWRASWIFLLLARHNPVQALAELVRQSDQCLKRGSQSATLDFWQLTLADADFQSKVFLQDIAP